MQSFSIGSQGRLLSTIHSKFKDLMVQSFDSLLQMEVKTTFQLTVTM